MIPRPVVSVFLVCLCALAPVRAASASVTAPEAKLAALGVASLPLGAVVEIEMVVEIERTSLRLYGRSRWRATHRPGSPRETPFPTGLTLG